MNPPASTFPAAQPELTELDKANDPAAQARSREVLARLEHLFRRTGDGAVDQQLFRAVAIYRHGANAMRQTNERAPATPSSSAMQSLTFADVMAEMRELPSLPAAVETLISALRDDAISTDHLAHDIAMDPALAARVLRVANSPFYGVQKKVASIHDAIVVLGLNAVGSLVMAASVTGYFKPTTDSGLDLSHFWRHSICVALSARVLARGVRRAPEICFTAGLLHDIGRLLLATLRPLYYQQVMAWRNEQDCLISAAESHVLGFDHGELGAALAERWRFPAEIVDAVASHHHPAGKAHATLVDVVHVADAIAHALDLEGEPDELVPSLDANAWLRLNLSEASLQALLMEVEQAHASYCTLLATP